MFKNKSGTGNNLCGPTVAMLRQQRKPRMSQRMLAEQMQLLGVDLDKNAIQRIESGQRFVTDIELLALAQVFGVRCDDLLHPDNDTGL